MKFTVQLPAGVELKEFDFILYVATKLYEDGLISAGQGAEMAGLTKRSFIEILGKYGVSLFSGDENDLLKDIRNA